MEYTKCNSEVWCLNSTSEGEACYNCIKKLGLKIVFNKINQSNLRNEIITKEEFA